MKEFHVIKKTSFIKKSMLYANDITFINEAVDTRKIIQSLFKNSPMIKTPAPTNVTHLQHIIDEKIKKRTNLVLHTELKNNVLFNLQSKSLFLNCEK